jgi:hypothetical protein
MHGAEMMAMHSSTGIEKRRKVRKKEECSVQHPNEIPSFGAFHHLHHSRCGVGDAPPS